MLILEGHSILSPSSASRWVKCPGSIKLLRSHSLPDGHDGDEGTESHDIAKDMLTGVRPIDRDSSDDKIRHAAFYADYVLSFGPGPAVERKIGIPYVHPSCFGTVDSFSNFGDTLHIFDYKYGWGIVDAFENWQLLCYAIGIVLGVPVASKITFHVVQPRPAHPDGKCRTWTITTEQLASYTMALNAAAVTALEHPDPPCVTGPHCRNCRGRHVCGSLRKAGLDALSMVCGVEAHELDVTALGQEYSLLKRLGEEISYRATGLEAVIEAKIRGGERVPGWSLGSGSGRMVWNTPAAGVLVMGDLLGVDLRTPASPAQARERGIPQGVINRFTSVGKSAVNLVPEGKTNLAAVFSGQK